MTFDDLLERLSSEGVAVALGRSILGLRAFIDGWILGADSPDTSSLIKFESWLQSKYDLPPGIAWHRIIRLYALDDVDAYFKFFELWKEFHTEDERSAASS